MYVISIAAIKLVQSHIIYMVEKSSIWKESKDLLNKRIVHHTRCVVVVYLVKTQY